LKRIERLNVFAQQTKMIVEPTNRRTKVNILGKNKIEIENQIRARSNLTNQRYSASEKWTKKNTQYRETKKSKRFFDEEILLKKLSFTRHSSHYVFYMSTGKVKKRSISFIHTTRSTPRVLINI
jgi:hypothetical protein